MSALFAIAGIQEHLSAVTSNVPRMETRLDVLMRIYPWVQMVVFSELAPFGPLTVHASCVRCSRRASTSHRRARPSG